MRLRGLIAAFLGVVMIGAVGLIAAMNNKNQEEFLNENAQIQLNYETQLISQEVDMFLSGNMDTIETLAEIIARENEEDWNNQNLKTALNEVQIKMNFANINIFNRNGIGYDLEGKEQKVAFCPYFQRALLGDTSITFSDFYENSEEEDLIFTVPIHYKGEITGVLRASMEIGVFNNLMSFNTFRGKEDVYLLQQDGKIMAALTENTMETKDFFSLLDTNDLIYNELMKVINQGKSLLTKATFRDVDCYLSFAGIKNLIDGGIMVTIPRDQLLELFHEDDKTVSSTYQLILLMTVIITAALLVFMSIVESMKRYRIERLAYYDEVTEGINYNRFKKDTSVLLHKSSNKGYAIIEIAIDRFDYIKEFFGIQESYLILKYISQILKENVKSDEIYCRLNTDYFVLLLKCHNKEELSNRINYLDIKIGGFEEKDIKKDKYELRLHYGIYCIEEDDVDLELMISRANHALFLVKNDKKQPYEYYTGAMQNRIIDEKEIEEHMNIALEEKEFLVYFQPKYDLNTGMQVGAEALVRWLHPEKGLMYPGRFIGVLEKNGFIVKLDMYILDILCHWLKVWIEKGYRPIPLSINISRLNLFDENFIDNIEAILERYGIPANLIQLEIAEEVVSDNIELLSSLMERLKEYGFLISMDDFGTGTTSMNTLYHIHVDELKLDRKFLLGAEKTERGKNVIKSIIEMAKRLDINVVSEGVENKAQAKMLKELGCDMIQGFVFSDPLPIKEYESYAYGPKAKENKVW